MKFASQFRIVAVALALSFVASAPVAAQDAESSAPAAQSAQAAVGDARPATLGDIKHTNARIDAQGRELRETMNAIWATMVIGFIAVCAAIIQSGKQARAQNNSHSSGRAHKLQVAAVAVAVAAAVPVVIVAAGN